VSLSRAAQSRFQTRQSIQAARTMRSGRCVRISVSCKSDAENQAPANYEQHGTTPEGMTGPQVVDVSSKLAAPPAVTLEGLPTKLVDPSAVHTVEATIENEPDAEPGARADHPAAQMSSDTREVRRVGIASFFDALRGKTKDAWEVDAEVKMCQAELRSLTAQLIEAREQAERLKANAGDIAAERENRREAEDRSAKLELKCRAHDQAMLKMREQKAKEHAKFAAENAHLERKLRQLSTRKGMVSPRSTSGTNQLAAHMAGAECGPLRRCSAMEKAALKKKLLLKWHPDKQPSADHSTFATRVMQEMQNCAEWKE